MKKYPLLFIFLLLTILTQARTITGTVKSNGHPLSKVVVSDGKYFAQTNNRGNFKLQVDSKSHFVFIVTPSGYTAPFSSGTPIFYQSISNEISDYHFQLNPLPSSNNYVLIAMADVQTKTNKQLEQFKEQAIPDIQKLSQNYLTKDIATVGINLGDISWDNQSIYPDYKKAISVLSFPIYPVIGNHDYRKDCSDPVLSAENYSKAFGPCYYAFNLGKDYYIVLNDIIYQGNLHYQSQISPEQILWVKNYLNYIPKGSRIIFAMHAPYRDRTEDNKEMISAKVLTNLSSNYRISFLSGHTHVNSNEIVEKGVVEHNIGAICGAWWTSPCCKDGTPEGYQVFEKTNEKLSWYYKSIGKSEKEQIKLFDEGTFPNNPNAVVAEVWNWGPGWTISWNEDGQDKGTMKQFSAYDPEYSKYVQNYYPSNIPNYCLPIKSNFYFAALPGPDAKNITVKVSDPFGRTYTKSIQRNSLEVQAHRGGAGLMPENTIHSMLNAVKLGVNTLELDLVITKDHKVVVSHNTNMNGHFITNPDGTPIDTLKDKTYTLYSMPYDSVKQYETGLKYYPTFPEQHKMEAHIPLISFLIDTVEAYTHAHQLGPIHYNIEIKSWPSSDKVLTPEYHQYTDLVMDVLSKKNLGDRMNIQSFDPRTLDYMHKKYPAIRLSYLVDTDYGPFDKNIHYIHFTPEYYSPNYKMVNPDMIQKAHQLGIKIIPWTVDKVEDMKKLIKMGVDGIITNYPDQLLQLTRAYTTNSSEQKEAQRSF